MDILWKGLIGGVVTALIVWASKRGDVLPGILPLAPTFAVIALVAVGSKGGDDGFRTTCLAGAKTIPAYLVFLATCYLLIGRIGHCRGIVWDHRRAFRQPAARFVSSRRDRHDHSCHRCLADAGR